ncbi:mannose-6-phosphate isomerase, class I [Vibrio mimicus]|uniref:mannose-6-phosphate isomerase, class I n=1 Tax=Vibrio mimicus TaxID=674 RepID=UPI0011D8742C|nr:mannose-6-phosphate isomerase, class I [Vibrio mimicus]TXY10320.1 mannose-6-phosphate isomerase, class I [Vibrio mimicus]
MQTDTRTPFFIMHNTIQPYAWGCTNSISQLFGIANPKGEPQAEVWMGAHPNGCSCVEFAGEQIKLSTLIEQEKSAFLSAQTAEQFGELPYLFKILAAAQALSIQVHPSKAEAEDGFARENAQGIAIHAAHRNYKDPNHKPELVYALTNYQAMNGFRPLSEIITLFSILAIDELTPLLNKLQQNQNEAGLEHFFTSLLSLTGENKTRVVDQLLSYAHAHVEQPLFALIEELATQYPGDIGLFAPLILHVLTLQPGEAMFLDARTPHAYLKGTALEIMANSDNVLRAGLTPKHIDVVELAKCTLFKEKPATTLLLTPIQQGEMLSFPVPVDDFKFAIFPQPQQVNVTVSSAEILLPIDCDATLVSPCGTTLTVHKGQSVFIPAYTPEYRLSAAGRVARAYN